MQMLWNENSGKNTKLFVLCTHLWILSRYFVNDAATKSWLQSGVNVEGFNLANSSLLVRFTRVC